VFKSILRPASQSRVQKEMVSDLDAIIQKTITFRLLGRVHEIRPISTKSYLEYINALAAVIQLSDQDKVTPTELIQKYHALVSSVVDSISLSDVESMTQAQVGALFQLIMDTITGKSHVEGEKKRP